MGRVEEGGGEGERGGEKEGRGLGGGGGEREGREVEKQCCSRSERNKPVNINTS